MRRTKRIIRTQGLCADWYIIIFLKSYATALTEYIHKLKLDLRQYLCDSKNKINTSSHWKGHNFINSMLINY